MSEGRDLPTRLGWWLSSEEHDPRELVKHAVLAEQTGFATAMISDHLQPWTRRQGNASFVWSVIGAIGHATDELQIGTGVTALVARNHPINIAQASATAAVMCEDRFFLGVGAGERLNEQAFGVRWTRAGERRDQLEEAIEVIQRLWSGKNVNHRGTYWNVENLSLHTRPATPPSLYMAAGGARSAKVAGKVADGMIGVEPNHKNVEVFRGSGGAGKPCIGQLHVSLGSSAEQAADNAWEWWTQGVVPPMLFGELARPQHFEEAAKAVGRDGIADVVVCATDAGPVIEAIDRFVGAGYDTVYLHQVGPDQQRLADLAASELLPHYATAAGTA
jgi:coenzyme F420-dependent glucose-6-phosphate dehydrogenase